MFDFFQIEKYGEESVNVREVLLEMRKYRMGLIQTHEQLRFSYLAIIKGAKKTNDEEVWHIFHPLSLLYVFLFGKLTISLFRCSYLR